MWSKMEEIKGRGILGIFQPSPMAIYKELYHVYMRNTCSLHCLLRVCKIIKDQLPINSVILWCAGASYTFQLQKRICHLLSNSTCVWIMRFFLCDRFAHFSTH